MADIQNETETQASTEEETRGPKAFFYDINEISAVNFADLVAAGQIAFDGIEHFGDRIIEQEIVNLPTISLIQYTIAPGTRVPHHHHDCHQIDFILAGSLHYGDSKKILTKGMGFFAPKGQIYSWTAGPDGCTFLEVHDKGDFLTLWREAKDRWPPHRNWGDSENKGAGV
jgi:quercetin dioxygenase-like cupin family protein